MSDTHIDHDGIVRRLGWKPPSTDFHMKMRATRESIQDLREDAGRSRLIPESDWIEKDFVTPLGTDYINNQQNCSGCTGWSAAQAQMRMRAIRGLPFVKLSGAFIYALINGGHDNGSVITDAMAILQTIGVCEQSEFDYPHIFEKQIPPSAYESAKKNRMVGTIKIDNFDECVTALMMNMIPQFPICVGNNFDHFSGDGVAGLTNSSQGNHSVHGAGLRKVNRIWYIVMGNTWGPWGPFKNGTVLLSRAHVDNCAYSNDGYAHADAQWSPQA